MPEWRPTSADPENSQELDDLVTLAALASRAPAAVLATFEGSELSTVHSYGLSDEVASAATELISVIGAGEGLVEMDDLGAGNAQFQPVDEPVNFQWACGLPVRAPAGGLRAVLAVVDMRRRELTASDQTALMAVGRRIRHSLLSRAEPLAAEPPAAEDVIDLTSRSGQPDAGAEGKSEVLRCVEVAEIFAVSERTVMKWAAQGRIPSFRTAGGRLRFRHHEIAAFIEDHSRSIDAF